MAKVTEKERRLIRNLMKKSKEKLNEQIDNKGKEKTAS